MYINPAVTRELPFLSYEKKKKKTVIYFSHSFLIFTRSPPKGSRHYGVNSRLFNVVLNHEMRFADVGEDLEPQAQRHQSWLKITKGSSISGGAGILTIS